MSAYDKVMAARDANKITTVDYINHMFGDSFFELHGDRRYSDDKAVVAGCYVARYACNRNRN